MVFSSVPLYLDPPNWQQHPNQQVLLAGNNNNHQGSNHEQNLHLVPPHQQPHQVGRPSSMTERARLAKIPPPEVPLKCPRCESTNTKFCYFNNYNLTQPRHFCKTCRRYWTRGGALRNVPVGGGCRRNKRASSKSSSGGVATVPSPSKSSISSPIMGGQPRHGGGLDQFMSSSLAGLSSGVGNNMSFMASLQNLAQLGGMSGNMVGLNFPGGPHLHHNRNIPLGGEFPQLNVGGAVGGGNSGGGGVQFPNFLGGFEVPGSSSGGGRGGAGLYSSSFQSDNSNTDNTQGGIGSGGGGGGEEHERVNNISKSLTTMMTTPVKLEENGQQRLNLSKQLMGISASSHNINPNNLGNNNSINQFWGGGALANAAGGGGGSSLWTDLSGLNSSTSQQLL